MNKTKNKFYLNDPESGENYEVSERKYKNYLSLYESLIPKYLHNTSSKDIIVFGTGGDLESNNFKKMWENL